MLVNEDEVRAMLVEMGYAAAGDWTRQKLAATLNDPTFVDGTREPANPALRDQIIRILENDGKVSLEDRNSTKEKSSVAVKTGTKSGASRKLTNGSAKGKSPATPKNKKETDRFGTRIGTLNAEINKRLSQKPKTDRQLTDEAGLAEKGYGWSHLKKLAEDGKIIMEGNGKDATFRLKPKDE